MKIPLARDEEIPKAIPSTTPSFGPWGKKSAYSGPCNIRYHAHVSNLKTKCPHQTNDKDKQGYEYCTRNLVKIRH